MSTDLKTYRAMKDSGVLWLGEVPEHWAIERLKSSIRNVIQQTAERQGSDIYVALEHVESWTGRLRQAASDVSFDSQVKRFRSGDVLFGKLRPYLAKVTRPTSDGVCVGEFLVFRPRDSNTSAPYVEQLLRSKPIIDAVNSSTFGAKMPRADWKFMGGMAVTLPPLPEQAAIVRFLDHADRRIRRHIRAKQKLIKLLEELKQAIIHRAVTRGLDPNFRLKPSGVEWLGDAPEHWEEILLGRCLRRIDQGWSPVAPEGEILANQWAVLTLSSVKRGVFNSASIKPVPISARIPDGIEAKEGDLLLTRSNTRELVGDVCIVRGVRPKTVICDLIYRLILEPTIFDPKFLMFQLLSPLGRRQIERDARGSSGTMPKIAQRHIRSWRVLVPTLEEQQKIVSAIQDATKNINKALNRAQNEISLLREYRTRLIADVVTGKLDMRESAARLPHEAGEPEPLDEADALTNTEDEPLDDLDTELAETDAEDAE